ncbi:MAG: lipid-A-disaccharide synthase [Chthoniobacterales bacterium]
MKKRIWIVAGEASGDARSAELMRAIHMLDAGVEFVGAGGPKMQPLAAQPFDNWIAEAGVLGLWDVLKHYGYFRAKFHRMLSDIARLNPDAVLLVDYPGFNLRLAKALRARLPKLRILYYVSPQVWAWNRGRIPKMAKYLDLMLCIFPFEKPLYEESGLRTEFVGHPIVEQMANDRMRVERDANLLGLFPGSREREVRRIFPAMIEAAKRVAAARPDVRFEASAASEPHAVQMRELAGGFPIEIRAGSAHELMQRAGTGIVCSGTATLEAACFGLPYALVYKTAWLTFEVGRRLVKINHLGIVNILAGRTVVREFIQDAATPTALAGEALRLLNDPAAREKLSAELAAVVATLHGEGASTRAARAVLDALSPDGRFAAS